MKEHNLSPRARRVLHALVRTLIPRNAKINFPLEDDMQDFVDGYMDHFPSFLKFLFPLGLYFLEFGTWVFFFSWRRFSRLPAPDRERYIAGWAGSRFFLKRELIKGVRGLALLAFYSDPQVCEAIGYRHQEWIEFAKKRRLESYAEDIRQKEALIRGKSA